MGINFRGSAHPRNFGISAGTYFRGWGKIWRFLKCNKISSKIESCKLNQMIFSFLVYFQIENWEVGKTLWKKCESSLKSRKNHRKKLDFFQNFRGDKFSRMASFRIFAGTYFRGRGQNPRNPRKFIPLKYRESCSEGTGRPDPLLKRFLRHQHFSQI